MDIPKHRDEPDEFDVFLTQASQEDILKRYSLEAIEQNKQTIDIELRNFEVDNVIFADGSYNEPLVEDIAHFIAENNLVNLGIARDSEQTQAQIQNAIAERSLNELKLYAQIMIFNVANSFQPLTLEQTLRMDSNKAQIIADWILSQQLHPDSLWIDFLNKLIPGRTLSTDDINEALITEIDAQDENKDKKIEDKYKRIVAQNSSGLEAMFEVEPELELPLYTLALQSKMLKAPELEEKISEQARILQVSPKSIRTYIAGIVSSEQQ
jgi:hypothetical protein